MNDLISRQAAIDFIDAGHLCNPNEPRWSDNEVVNFLKSRPSAQPERLTDDDFETIRIHLNAYKEKLGNQRRWKEAEEYQRIIDRFMSFASAQPERTGKWIDRSEGGRTLYPWWECYKCSQCGHFGGGAWIFCPNCGARMES